MADGERPQNVNTLLDKIISDAEALKDALQTSPVNQVQQQPPTPQPFQLITPVNHFQQRPPTPGPSVYRPTGGTQQQPSFSRPPTIRTPTLTTYRARSSLHSYRFPKSTGPAPKKPRRTPFMINRIVLLDKRSITTVLSPSGIEQHRNAKLISDFCQTITKESTPQEVREEICKRLPQLFGTDFTYLKVEDKKLVELNLQYGAEVDGVIIHGLAYRSTLYIRPEYDLNLIKSCVFRSARHDSNSDFDDETFEGNTCEEKHFDDEPFENNSPEENSCEDELFERNPSKEENCEDERSKRNTCEEIINFETHASSSHTISTSTVDTKNLCKDIMRELKSKIGGPTQELEINRRSVLEDMKDEMRRPSFSLCRPVCVTFTDMIGVEHPMERFKEEAYDIGGPTREMLSIGLQNLRDSPMFGGENGQNLIFNANNFYAAEGLENDYCIAGKFIVLSFLHGGPGPQFFSEELYDSVLVGNLVSPSLRTIGSPHIRDAIERISSAKNLDELREAITNEDLQEAGLKTYASSIGQKETFVKQAVQYFAEYKIQPALKSFVDGLSNCGFLEAVKQHPSVFKPFFIPAPAPSTKKEFLEIFHYQRSRVGGNKFDVESKVISFFGSFLKDCEEGIAASTEIGHVSIPELLHFATGMGRQPPGGSRLNLPSNSTMTNQTSFAWRQILVS